MSISISAATGMLDNYAFDLARTADAKPAATSFLDQLATAVGSRDAPVLASHHEIRSMPEVAAAWDSMHQAVRGVIANIETPLYGTAGVKQARELVNRLAFAERSMAAAERHPNEVVDVSGIAYSVNSRIDDITSRGVKKIFAEAAVLRAFEPV